MGDDGPPAHMPKEKNVLFHLFPAVQPLSLPDSFLQQAQKDPFSLGCRQALEASSTILPVILSLDPSGSSPGCRPPAQHSSLGCWMSYGLLGFGVGCLGLGFGFFCWFFFGGGVCFGLGFFFCETNEEIISSDCSSARCGFFPSVFGLHVIMGTFCQPQTFLVLK